MLQEKLEKIQQIFREYPEHQVIVAYSGGIDSSLVAKIAYDCLGVRAIAVTANSPSLAPLELELAIKHAQEIGILHRVIETHEVENPNYARNYKDRCYFCKSELHDHLKLICQEFPQAVVMDGVNADDLRDFRPGIRAAKERNVRSPLAEVGLSKLEVRQLAKELGLSWWHKPAQPCLSSRFPYGEPITLEKLARVAQAETYLRMNGWEDDLRVRSYGNTAKIEVPLPLLPAFTQRFPLKLLIPIFQSYGFEEVVIDETGFQSGKLNSIITK